MFKCQFDTDNAAFGDTKAYETALILRAIVSKIERGIAEGNVRDSNGNTVGTWRLTP